MSEYFRVVLQWDDDLLAGRFEGHAGSVCCLRRGHLVAMWRWLLKESESEGLQYFTYLGAFVRLHRACMQRMQLLPGT